MGLERIGLAPRPRARGGAHDARSRRRRPRRARARLDGRHPGRRDGHGARLGRKTPVTPASRNTARGSRHGERGIALLLSLLTMVLLTVVVIEFTVSSQ